MYLIAFEKELGGRNFKHFKTDSEPVETHQALLKGIGRPSSKKLAEHLLIAFN